MYLVARGDNTCHTTWISLKNKQKKLLNIISVDIQFAKEKRPMKLIMIYTNPFHTHGDPLKTRSSSPAYVIVWILGYAR